MSILSSNNAGVQELIKQWWINVRSKNSSYPFCDQGIDVVWDDDGYIIIDSNAVHTSIKIAFSDWSSRSSLLKGIYYTHFSADGSPIDIDIIPTNNVSPEIIDLSNITNFVSESIEKKYHLNSKKKRWNISIYHCADSEIFGLNGDMINLTTIVSDVGRGVNMHDIAGDVNILLKGDLKWAEHIKDIHISGHLKVDMLTGEMLEKDWDKCCINKKKNRFGIVPKKEYIPKLDAFFESNQIKHILVSSPDPFPLDKDHTQHYGSYVWWHPVTRTWSLLPHNRYSYKLD